MSDITALGALAEARRQGLIVPDDISIVGFDDIPETRWTQPGLTTVSQATEAKGRIAAQLLMDLIAGDTEPEHTCWRPSSSSGTPSQPLPDLPAASRVLTGTEWTMERIPDNETFEFKPLINDTTWSTGSNYTGRGGDVINIYPDF